MRSTPRKHSTLSLVSTHTRTRSRVSPLLKYRRSHVSRSHDRSEREERSGFRRVSGRVAGRGGEVDVAVELPPAAEALEAADEDLGRAPEGDALHGAPRRRARPAAPRVVRVQGLRRREPPQAALEAQGPPGRAEARPAAAGEGEGAAGRLARRVARRARERAPRPPPRGAPRAAPRGGRRIRVRAERGRSRARGPGVGDGARDVVAGPRLRRVARARDRGGRGAERPRPVDGDDGDVRAAEQAAGRAVAVVRRGAARLVSPRAAPRGARLRGAPVWKSTAGLGGPDQT